jgi:hypothetical protein
MLNPARCDECRRVKEKCEGGVPCNRCAHFQRPCEFKGSAARQPTSNTRDQRFVPPYETISWPDSSETNQQSRTSSDAEIEDLRARSNYMEHILRHTFPQLEFGIDNLRCKAESLTLAKTPRHGFDEGTDSDIDGDLNIEDENCTINAVDDTIARR